MFYLFAGDHYYPLGGWEDFRGVYPRLEDAKLAAGRFDWAHIVSVKERRIVAERWEEDDGWTHR